MYDILIFLLHFRLNVITKTEDTEGAFLQIALDPEERKAVRFLWVTKDSCEVLRMTCEIFGGQFC